MNLSLRVVAAASETALVRRIVLASSSGESLPGFEPGAHVTVQVPGVGRRKYSLVSFEPSGAERRPATYVLGVRRDDAGQGGSLFMHALKIGDALEVEAPENDFRLAEGGGPVTLIAGGIGITPLIAKAATLKAAGRPFRLVYAARAQAEFAFLPELRRLCGDALVLHADEDAGGLLDIKALVDSLGPDEPVYICGPRPMIRAAVQESRALGWPEQRLRFELFFSPAAAPPAPPPAPAPAPAADSFEVEIRSTGAVYAVPAGKSILSVLIEAGVDPLHDCDKGECGVCQVDVIEGVPDHRDSILSEAERAAGKTMQICVSRSKSPRLVLDL